MDKSVLLLKESIAIETLQYQYTGRTIKTKRVNDMSCHSGFDQCLQKSRSFLWPCRKKFHCQKTKVLQFCWGVSQAARLDYKGSDVVSVLGGVHSFEACRSCGEHVALRPRYWATCLIMAPDIFLECAEHSVEYFIVLCMILINLLIISAVQGFQTQRSPFDKNVPSWKYKKCI